MKTLGIIIGTQDEPVSKKYYKNNKKMLKVLKEYDVSMDYIPYDFAIFAEVNNLGKKYNVDSQLLKKLPVGINGKKLIKIDTKHIANGTLTFIFIIYIPFKYEKAFKYK